MKRHLIPRIEWGGWSGAALTIDPAGGREMPNGLERSLREALGRSTRMPEHDEVRGGVLCFQWLGLMVEIGVGRVR